MNWKGARRSILMAGDGQPTAPTIAGNYDPLCMQGLVQSVQLPRRRGEVETPTSNQPPRGAQSRRLLGPAALRSCPFASLHGQVRARLGPGGYYWRSGNGGPQTCLPAACGVAQGAAQDGPSSSARAQHPREGPSLAGRMTGSFLRHDLIRLAREEAERSRRGTSRGAHDASHDDRGQAGARRAPACTESSFLFGAKGESACKSIKQTQPFRCNKTKTSRTAGWRSSWSPSWRHDQGLWQARTDFSQDKCTRCSPSKWPIVGALPAQYLGRGPGPLPINRTSHPQGRGDLESANPKTSWDRIE